MRFLLLLAPLLACNLQAQDEGHGRPNIVVLFADDHSQAAVSCYGSRINQTPHIDALAKRGVRFTQSFVSNSICAPSRAVFLTGAHSHRNGQTGNRGGFRDELPSLPKGLQDRGYRTGVIGKWHLPTDPSGFDDWTLVEGGYYTPSLRKAQGREPISGHCTEVITARSEAWLRARAKSAEPFFLWVSYKAAHRTWDPGPAQLGLYRGATIPEPPTLFDDYAGRSPAAAATQMRIARDLFPAYDLKLPVTGEGILDNAATRLRARMPAVVRKRWDDLYGPENEAFAAAKLDGEALVGWKYQRYIQDYLRCVAGLDASVGRLMQTLEDLELTENTLVVYTSDQGFFLGEHGWYDKRWMYEPALRTPLILAGPDVQPGTCDALVQNIDLAPTLLQAADAPIPTTVQGLSLIPWTQGTAQDPWRQAIYYHYQQQDRGRISHTVARHRGIRTQSHKLIHIYDLDDWELYDLDADPHEMNNLAGDPGSAVLETRLRERLASLRQQVGDA